MGIEIRKKHKTERVTCHNFTDFYYDNFYIWMSLDLENWRKK